MRLNFTKKIEKVVAFQRQFRTKFDVVSESQCANPSWKDTWFHDQPLLSMNQMEENPNEVRQASVSRPSPILDALRVNQDYQTPRGRPTQLTSWGPLHI